MSVTTPSSVVTARRIPPPGWTSLASASGTVGERSRQPSRSSSYIGSSTRPTGPSSIGVAGGRAAVAQREAGPVGEVALGRAGVAGVVAAGELVERARRGRARAGARARRRCGRRSCAGGRRSPRGAIAWTSACLARPVASASSARVAGSARDDRLDGGVRVGHAELAQPPLVGRDHPRREQRVQPREVLDVDQVQRRAHQPGDRAGRRGTPPPRALSARGSERASCACTASRWRTTSPPGACSHWPRARGAPRLTHRRRTRRRRAWAPAAATRPRSAPPAARGETTSSRTSTAG